MIDDEVIKPVLPQALNLLSWNQHDGPIDFVYQNMPQGHRCAWSVRWQCGTEFGSNVCVMPSWWFPHGTPGKYLKYEFDDVLARRGQYLQAQDIEFIKNFNPHDDDFLVEAQEIVRRLRPNYPEFIFVPNRPANIMVFRRRPGWE